MSAPKIEIEGCSILDSCYTRKGYTQAVPCLIEASKDLPVFDLPLAAVDLSYCWKIESLSDFIYHMKRCQDADDKYPVILDDEGIICDGRHRAAKGILSGKETIKAVRIQKMPQSDSYTKPEQTWIKVNKYYQR